MPYRFTFGEDGEAHPMFQANLRSFRCQGHNVNRNRSNRTTVIGEPYCWQHMRSEKHLTIKPSHIPNAGKGLFAYDRTQPNDAVIFRTGDDITPYLGQEINTATLKDRYGEFTAPYGMELNGRQRGRRYLDSATQRGIGSLINHTTRRAANCEYVGHGYTCRIRAIKQIRNGQELLVNYGRAYQFDEPTHYSTKYIR